MLRSLWAWSAVTILIVCWLPMLAVIRLFDGDPALYRTGYWFRRLGWMMTKVNPMWRVHVSGHRVVDPRRPYVVVSNRSEEHTSELQSRENIVCRLLLEKKKRNRATLWRAIA